MYLPIIFPDALLFVPVLLRMPCASEWDELRRRCSRASFWSAPLDEVTRAIPTQLLVVGCCVTVLPRLDDPATLDAAVVWAKSLRLSLVIDISVRPRVNNLRMAGIGDGTFSRKLAPTDFWPPDVAGALLLLFGLV